MSIPKISSYPMPAYVAAPNTRVTWQCNPRRAVFLIHDMQQYFVRFFDVTQSPVPQLQANLQAIKSACQTLGIPVVYSAQPPVQSAQERGLLQSWWGNGITAAPEQAEIVTELAPSAEDKVMTKWRYSAFAKTDLAQWMQANGRDQLIIGGVYAHIGCMMTAADAFMRDIEVFYLADGVADFSRERHEMAIEYVNQCCGVALLTDTLLGQLNADDSHSSSGIPTTMDALRQQVAALIEMTPDELDWDDSLLFAGLDSVRLMSLVDRWQQQGSRLGFAELAQAPTLRQWWDLLQRGHA